MLGDWLVACLDEWEELDFEAVDGVHDEVDERGWAGLVGCGAGGGRFGCDEAGR